MSAFSVIMLFLMLCVVSLTIAEDQINILDPEFRCSPGQLFNHECNSCTCAEDGKDAVCTYKLCPSENGLVRPGEPEFKCTPGDLFRYDCYDCRCFDGKNAFCNFASCNAKNSDQHSCENGASKNENCNNCKCLNGEWACTKKFCVPEVDVFENKECESGSTLRRGCNICRCVPDLGYACDKLECPPDLPTDIINDKNCTEGTVYNLGCNLCKCIPGLGYACDRRECPEAVFVN